MLVKMQKEKEIHKKTAATQCNGSRKHQTSTHHTGWGRTRRLVVEKGEFMDQALGGRRGARVEVEAKISVGLLSVGLLTPASA